LASVKIKTSRKKAADYLREALENYGIGAKTALGYGIFVFPGEK